MLCFTYICYVPDEPIWMPMQRSIFYGFISGTSNLTCGARAEPPATFTWYDDKSGKPIQKGAILTENHISTLVVRITLLQIEENRLTYLLHFSSILTICYHLPRCYLRLSINIQKKCFHSKIMLLDFFFKPLDIWQIPATVTHYGRIFFFLRE